MTDCDVLIVGGGPAGLSVASHLPTQARVILAHADARIGEPVRTSGGTWVRDMQALSIPPDLWQTIDQLDFFSDRAEARFAVARDKMAVMDVTGTYRHLARLSDGHNRDLQTGCSLIGATRLADGRILARLRSRAEGETEVRARFVVEASGWKMAVMEALGLGRKPGRTGVGIEFEFERGDYPTNRAILFVGSAALTGYGWVFPAPNDRLRLGIGVIHPDTDLSPRTVMSAFQAGGHADRFGVTIPDAVQTNAGIIPSVAYDPALVFGNVIRVGDAANMATPTVGEGIRIAIEQGRMLGQALGNALVGDDQALDRWQAAAARRYTRDYRFGLMMNRRIAGYTPDRWDRSVRRLSRLDEDQMTALVRSQFSPAQIARTLALSIWAKLRG